MNVTIIIIIYYYYCYHEMTISIWLYNKYDMIKWKRTPLMNNTICDCKIGQRHDMWISEPLSQWTTKLRWQTDKILTTMILIIHCYGKSVQFRFDMKYNAYKSAIIAMIFFGRRQCFINKKTIPKTKLNQKRIEPNNQQHI